jgi:REP element-mobilizing transposase RayT
MSGWHHRGYLPHVDFPHLWQSVTFRLADSLPTSVLERWKRELRNEPNEERDLSLRRLIDTYEDAGHGVCLLRDNRCAATLWDVIIQQQGIDYQVAAWVVMPNHVHVVVGPVDHKRLDLSQIVKRWKGISARRINQLLERTGTVWQNESFDRWIRDEQHFANVVRYIAENPVKAGLCRTAGEWRWSHAWTGGVVPSPPSP